MNNSNKLIVPFYKENIQKALIFIPIVILMALFLVYTFNFFADYISSSIILTLIFCIKILLYSFIGLLTFAVMYNFFFADYDTPAAILDEKGFWMKRHGLIPWNNIDIFTQYAMPTVKHIKYIGIHVKDTKLLSKQSNWEGKMGIFWAKIFPYYHITLANISISNDKVVQFARQFVPKK